MTPGTMPERYKRAATAVLRREGKVLESGITDDERYQGSFI